MMTRLLAITGILAVGHAVLLGLFWLLLGVPESNVLMLALSAALVVFGVVFAGWLTGVALSAWTPGCTWRQAVHGGVRAILPFLAGAAVFVAIWWATLAAGRAWVEHRGEIDAWLMLHVGWTRTAGLHTTVWWLLRGVRDVVGLSVALTLAAWALGAGFASLRRVRWLARALSPVRLIVVALLLFICIWVPWQAASWRPAWLSPNWQELLFTAVKLGVLYLFANLGWALVLRVAVSPRPSASRAPGAS